MSVESFDASWLALREAVDHRSRAEELTGELANWWAEAPRSRVLDLGSGTGSNVRYLAPRLAGRQAWRLLDHDPKLLSLVEAPSDVELETVTGDLSDLGRAYLAGTDLVTASALLDLVSAAWLDTLAVACDGVGSAALFTLTYDGTIEWRPGDDPADELVRDAVNAHQRRDKGFGPALGPAAVRAAEEAFTRYGFQVRTGASPWRLDAADADLAHALVEGWASAATQERPEEVGAVLAWAGRKGEAIRRGDFGLTVGHVDLLALPSGRAPEAS